MGFCLHPSLGKGQASLPTQWDDASLGLSGFQTICLAFQTEVQVLGDEDDDGLGKESWEFVVCSILEPPHPPSPTGDASVIVPRLMGGPEAPSSADSPCPQQCCPCRDNSLRSRGGCLRGRAGDRPGAVVGAQRGSGDAGGQRLGMSFPSTALSPQGGTAGAQLAVTGLREDFTAARGDEKAGGERCPAREDWGLPGGDEIGASSSPSSSCTPQLGPWGGKPQGNSEEQKETSGCCPGVPQP